MSKHSEIWSIPKRKTFSVPILLRRNFAEFSGSVCAPPWNMSPAPLTTRRSCCVWLMPAVAVPMPRPQKRPKSWWTTRSASGFTLCTQFPRLYLGMVVPGARISPVRIAERYEQMTRQVVLLGCLQYPTRGISAAL